MKTIHKYQLINIDSEVKVEMPRFAQILTLDIQRGIPCIWAIVHTEDKPITRTFIIKGTGHDCTDLGDDTPYIGTFFIHQENLVFHVFEKQKP